MLGGKACSARAWGLWRWTCLQNVRDSAVTCPGLWISGSTVGVSSNGQGHESRGFGVVHTWRSNPAGTNWCSNGIQGQQRHFTDHAYRKSKTAGRDQRDGGERSRQELMGATFAELAEILEGTGRAKLVWEELRKGSDLEQMILNLPQKTARLLMERLEPPAGEVVEVKGSECGTQKMLVRWQDGRTVEAVLIPSNGRTTLCLSSQVGCSRACVFCATGKLGLLRNLTTCEILSQVFHAGQLSLRYGMPPVTNVVFMGMGEPMNNWRAVKKAVDILTDTKAYGLSHNKVTVSTVGIRPSAISKLQETNAAIAWSLHAAQDSVRKELVPTTMYPMQDLRDAFVKVVSARSASKKGIFIEIALIHDINDSEDQAIELANFLNPFKTNGVQAKVNLIPYNDTGSVFFCMGVISELRSLT